VYEAGEIWRREMSISEKHTTSLAVIEWNATHLHTQFETISELL
jgi:hypothetical protein